MAYLEELCRLCDSLGCKYKEDEPLKNHTTFKIGGNARLLAEINSEETLSALLKYLRENKIRYFILGKGSNILAHDDGFDGVILKISSGFSRIEKTGETGIFCTAGTALSELCSYAQHSSLSGLEFAYGIPGTAGGALYMNAGAYGGEIKDVVVSARYIGSDGSIGTIGKEDMKLSYRHSIFSEDSSMIITGMTFSLTAGEPEQIRSKMNELLKKRKDKQPLEYPSAGSTFKRPEGSYASLLIEQCGLKGLSEGGAQVSKKHSGFVINKGNATFADVIKLTDKVKKIVSEKTGYSLELEPIILR
ncbi:MAG: UDP-N-acetylmuramate dehydrogenase [Porcipelethomonas sp.]